MDASAPQMDDLAAPQLDASAPQMDDLAASQMDASAPQMDDLAAPQMDDLVAPQEPAPAPQAAALAPQQGTMSQADTAPVVQAVEPIGSAPVDELSLVNDATAEGANVGAVTPVAGTTVEVTKLIATR
jgi:hypothetical protein